MLPYLLGYSYAISMHRSKNLITMNDFPNAIIIQPISHCAAVTGVAIHQPRARTLHDTYGYYCIEYYMYISRVSLRALTDSKD